MRRFDLNIKREHTMIQDEGRGRCQRRPFSRASVHILGLLVVAGALITMVDEAGTTDFILMQLGLSGQDPILDWALPIWALACFIFLLAPLVVRKPRGAFRILIGMPALARYLVAATALVVTVLVIEHVLFWPVGVIDIPSVIDGAQRDMIARETGPNVVLRGNQILFLEDKRATVENAIERRSIPGSEKGKRKELGGG
jgi:hypothetical protein